MLKFYLSGENNTLSEVNNIQKNCWINMIHPNEEEIRQVSSELNVPLDFIVDALDNYERSRVERDEDKVLIIVDFPIVINEGLNWRPLKNLSIFNGPFLTSKKK